MPKIIVCPHEFLTLTMAHGFAQVTGKAQAVLVHVDVGTQNMGGAVHNAMRGRVPVLIVAGLSPATAEGELEGSRNEFIHYLQDVPNQGGIVRDYAKYTQTVYTGKNIDKIVNRALQLAESEPKGVTYLMTPREVLAEVVEEPVSDKEEFTPITSSALDGVEVKEIVQELRGAKNPLIITSYVGRNKEAVGELVELAEAYAVPVIESGGYYVNFPTTHPLHAGYEDYTGNNESIARVRDADFILVLDCDVPWMPIQVKPKEDAKVYWVDIDPVKEDIPTWYYKATKRMRACTLKALRQLNEVTKEQEFTKEEEGRFVNRRKELEENYIGLMAEKEQALELQEKEGYITPEYLVSVVQKLSDEDTIFVNEAISNFGVVWRGIERVIPGSFYGSGASSLGWHGGAALGVKLANPDKTVVALTGDGTYMFSVPSSVHWISDRYKLPFLTVIFNNRGWKSPKLSTLGVHPDGVSNQEETYWTDFGETVRYEKIAEASGSTVGFVVDKAAELEDVLREAFKTVKEGRSAVVNVTIEPASEPVED